MQGLCSYLGSSDALTSEKDSGYANKIGGTQWSLLRYFPASPRSLFLPARTLRTREKYISRAAPSGSRWVRKSRRKTPRVTRPSK